MRRAFLLAVLAAPAPGAAADLEPFEPLVITASRWLESPRRSLRAVTGVSREELLRRGGASAAEALREEAGILVQRTMPGKAAVSVRGHIGKDNLVLIDGARLNNAVTENVQSLALIDPETVESIEVLRGPGSVLYGGDALGGVVYVVPRRRRTLAGPPQAGGRLSATWRSADSGRMGRAEVEGHRAGAGVLAGASLVSFSDLDLGGALGKARPTGYSGRFVDGAADWLIGETALRLTAQHARQEGVPRYDRYRDARRYGGPGEFSEFLIPAEQRDLVVGEVKTDDVEGLLREFEAKGYWHRQETRTFQQRTDSQTRQEQGDVADTLGIRVEAGLQPAAGWRLVAGVEAYEDLIRSFRKDVHLPSGFVTARDGEANYPDASRYGGAGAFTLGRWSLAPAWTLEGGARFSWIRARSQLRSPFAGSEFRDSYRSWTGGAGASWQAAESLLLVASVWQGFRPPNLNDTVALKSGPSGVDAPATGLRPEKSLGLELGARHRLGGLRQSLFLFHSRLTDRIERARGSFNGLAAINGAPVFQRSNSGRGYIQGLEWDGRLDLGGGFSARGNASWIYGRDSSGRVALTRIPPAMGLAGAGWEGTGPFKPWAQSHLRMAAAQRRLSPSDRLDPRINPAGTPAWATWNARAGVSPTPSTRVQGAMENLLDAAYREHGSGVDAPGFNLSLNAQWSF